MWSAISTFDFHENQIRVVLDSDSFPLFVAKDVAKALGYTDTINAIKQFCKGVVKRHPIQTAGGAQQMRVIQEPDVYRLIFGSKMESAIHFQNWVFEDVLPRIRKTGKYQPSSTPTGNMFSNLTEGRYLLVSRKGETLIRDIAGCSVVDIKVTDQLRRDIRTVQKANEEIAKRLAILAGDESKSLLENPMHIEIGDGNFKLTSQVHSVERQVSDADFADLTPSQCNPMLRDKVGIALQMLKTSYHPGDINRLCKELGIHRDTAKRILGGLHRKAEMMASA